MTSLPISRQEILGDMAKSLRHRGPDASGIWCDDRQSVGFAHCRLSILDLSEAGKQPMQSAGSRYMITFNGEIYNFRELRQQITAQDKQRSFRGNSDTEVLLAAIENWGLNATVQKLTGMFAFSLWDSQEKVLHLVRDRLGEKPLYYGYSNGIFAFASELKAFRKIPNFSLDVDRCALQEYIRCSYVPAPLSIYQQIRKLPPGTILSVKTTQIADLPNPVAYWDAMEIAKFGIAHPFVGSDQEAIDRLEGILTHVIQHQMVSDVPLGAFLSGGIDSSTIVAMMQRQSTRPIKTFTIGFGEKDYDESTFAAKVAEHLGTEHVSLRVSWDDALKVIPDLPKLYDEPFADSSQIPTYLVARLARENVTVSLSGDGGDEVFGGYNRHQWIPKIWNRIKAVPQWGRQSTAMALNCLSPSQWDMLFSVLDKFSRAPRTPGEKIQKFAFILSSSDPSEIYKRLTAQCSDSSDLVLRESTHVEHEFKWPNLSSMQNSIMLSDLIGYLPGDILAKVDRAAMACSLETRVPFLDHELISFAWQLPLEMKIRNGEGKWILRQVLERHVPRSLVDRPKAGFGVPIDHWLRGPLREWAEDLLNEKQLISDGYFNPRPIREYWVEHLSGKRRWHHLLWNVLMFNAWLKYNQ